MSKVNLDQFERKVVFRTARGYFIGVAALALLTFGLGVFFGMKGLTHIEPAAPVEPAPPAAVTPPAPMTIEDVKAWRDRAVEESADDDTRDVAELVGRTIRTLKKDQPNPIAVALDKVKALFPEPTYTWESEYSNRCVRNSPYGCLRRERVLERKGISSIIGELIKNREENDKDQLLRLLNAIVSTLEPVAVEERGGFLVDTVFAHRSKMVDYEMRLAAREQEIQELKQKYLAATREYEDELQRIKEERSHDLSMSGYGLALGLGLLACVGVFLAHLAIERHLRELREILATNPASSTRGPQ